MATHHYGIQDNLLEVNVVSCNKLKDTEWISRQDPYVYPYVCVEYARRQHYGAPQASLYSAPPPHASVSYPPQTTAGQYPPPGGYPAPSPYPAYPPNSGAYPPQFGYPPQSAYPPQPYPPKSAYHPQPYGSEYPPDGGKNPTFQEKFVYTLIEGLRQLNVNVWNSNTLKHDDFIGSGKVQLAKALSQGFDDSTWPLQSKTGRHAGEVRLHYSNANITMEPNFDFQGNSCFLQFWQCWDVVENGRYFLLTVQLSVSNIRDNRLEAYRRACLNDNYRFVGRERNVGDWFAGRAAQTQVADYQYNSEYLGLGQLVMPVYLNQPGAGLKLAGILELVTAQHNESYAAYFDQIQASLMEVNLTSTYLGKTIKVEYNQQLVKFTLPFTAKLPDLQEQVTMRFIELENQAFSIAYKDTNHIRHSILNDHDLHFCILGSILNRTTLIRMVVEDVVG